MLCIQPFVTALCKLTLNLSLFRQLCRDALKGEHCTKKCNKSINVLSKQIDGISIQKCDCDQSLTLLQLCRAEKYNVLKTCFDIELQSDMESLNMDNNSPEVEVYQISNSNITNSLLIINNNSHDLLHFELLLLIICLIMAFL